MFEALDQICYTHVKYICKYCYIGTHVAIRYLICQMGENYIYSTIKQ